MTLMTKEEALERASKIKDLYKTEKKFSAIIMGIYGSGKTSILLTAPKPILIDSFDPNGTIGIEQDYADEIEKGNLFIRKFWDEDTNNPHCHKDWEKQFDADLDSGFLNYFGTYAIDSMTTWIDTIANRVSKDMKRNIPKLAIQDYPLIYDHVKNTIKKLSTQDCIFLMTAHLLLEQDGITGAVKAELKTYKQLKADIPLLFTEKYVTQTSNSPKGVEYDLLTSSAGRYIASTQLGSKGKFKAREVPDIAKLIKKAGMKIPEKPPLK